MSIDEDLTAPGTIAIVVVTYNRLPLLRQCVENVLARTSDATREIVIWDNASTDGTGEYLDALDDPRFQIVRHPRNVGVNAYAIAFPKTSAGYLLELDDDVVDAPQGWDHALLDAYRRLPEIGFLEAKLADDGHSTRADLFYRDQRDLYRRDEVNGVRILQGGPVGGACTITSRVLHDRVGGFQRGKGAFFHEDHAYIKDIKKLGYRAAILDEIEVAHHGGPYYSAIVPEKVEYYKRRDRRVARKNAVKRMLLAVPLMRPLNQRFGWFKQPRPIEQR
jgi:GT2 family glycosyltransferase